MPAEPSGREAVHGENTLPNLRPDERSGLRRAPSDDALRVTDAAGVSHPGKVRSNNEDHFLVVDVSRLLDVRCSSLDPPPKLQPSRGTVLVVADGMGGHGQGEIASALAIDGVVGYLAHSMPWACSGDGRDQALHDGFQQAVMSCQRRIQAYAAERGADPTMGTTLTVVYALAGELFVAHVGDSRAYLYRDGYGLHRLTSDHTLGELLRQRGVDGKGQDHMLTQSVGGSREQPQIEARHDRAVAGDRLLLCSDGVSDVIDDERLGALLGARESAADTAAAIQREVLQTDARDNLTAVVADLG